MDEKEKSARRHIWVVALISGAAMLATCPARPTNGSEFAARTTEAGLAGPGNPQEMSPGQSPAELVGLDEQRVMELLGPAMSTESRAPASVWHYKSSRCELDLVFYMELRTGLMRTLHYDFKSGADTAVQRRACLTAIMQGNSKDAPSDKWPEKNVRAELSVENDVAPAPQAKPQTWRREPHLHGSHLAHYSRVRRNAWGYSLALRYSRPSYRYAPPSSGWSGGQFGPAPYSASGPQ
jgi:hypothetical protein